MKLPIAYRWLKAHNFEGLRPWNFIDPLNSDNLRKEYKLETGKDIIPFARRQDNDTFAGFEIVNDEIRDIVITVHLTWSSKMEPDPFPSSEISKDIFKWLEEIVFPDTKEWIDEEELRDVLDSEN
ncbi:hypothetical protein [Aureivirga sp. CE67]|uniref:hypothetical protein n=1 Tax=Aureivirga sp. CE67 TaxID=1788983 RepID=UPI0018C9434F|nr:hypothetical protein [Aureivirga sp. CE67]